MPLLILLFVIVIALLYWVVASLSGSKRTVESAPIVALSTIEDDVLCKVVGTIGKDASDALLRAPVSQREAVLYEAVLEREEQSTGPAFPGAPVGANLEAPVWRAVHTVRRAVPSAWVEDDSGRGLLKLPRPNRWPKLDLASASCTVSSDVPVDRLVRVLDNGDAELGAVAPDLDLEALALPKQYRLRESLIAEGERVLVIAQCAHDRETPGAPRVLVGGSKGKIALISNQEEVITRSARKAVGDGASQLGPITK